jgi:glycogen debranching enzyme
MRNYDTVDATPLYLMAMHAYWRVSGDRGFIASHMPHIRAALDWMLNYGDTNHDGFIDYRFRPDRSHGGLKVQSWMDSVESIFAFERRGSSPQYPIAPVEVQAYAYAALVAWSDYMARDGDSDDRTHSTILSDRARKLKEKFNRSFVVLRGVRKQERNRRQLTLAFAIDGNGTAFAAARSSMGHVLWAAAQLPDHPDNCILKDEYVPALVSRLMASDLYAARAGMRTLSTRSRHFDPHSYHNGSIWPHDTAMLAEGLENFGYHGEATRVRRSLARAYAHFEAPVELYAYHGRTLQPYQSATGQKACQTQAWSAASLLTTLQSLESN